MSVVLINDSTLTDIADAIRKQNGSNDTYYPSGMADAIAAIEGGGGGTTIPDVAIDIHKGLSGKYLFSHGMDESLKYINYTYITKTDLSDDIPLKLQHMFYDADLTNNTAVSHIPQIRIQSSGYKSSYNNGWFILQIPYFLENAKIDTIDTSILKIKKGDGSDISSNGPDIVNFQGFARSSTVKTIGDLSSYLNFIDEADSFDYKTSFWDFCSECRELRSISSNTLKKLKAKPISASNHPQVLSFATSFVDCYQLQALNNWPVITKKSLTDSRYSLGTLSNKYSLSSFTFDTNNGAPYSVTWDKQSATIGPYVGYGPSSYVPPASGNAIQTDKSLSVYNHDSAVATINSLPSVSGSCTLTFAQPSQGSATAAGAISDLTAAEIAVATAKGWTVTLAQES